MSYLVLARKYRPQTFGAMTGQEHVVRTLANALKSGQLAHAFLFSGPRGVGKTTSARLLAKCLNCSSGPTSEPCGTCPACAEIAEGRSVDVIEIDAASNNGVDNIRDIVEAVKYRPARDRFKIFIVDEVHMLSAGAFNALLKTLEEPPGHVKFVLATTDVHKVPETIVSRCQRFDFRRLTQQQIVDQLRRVAEAEGLRISDAALALVARSAEGGMRDALSTLDQVRAACGDEADDATVAEAVGAVDAGAVSRIAAAAIRRDGGSLLREIESLHGRGQEMKRVAEALVSHLRDVVVAKLVPQMPLDLPDAVKDEVIAQAGSAPAAQLTRLFDLAQRAVQEVKFSEQPRYAFEVALLKACFLAPGADIEELLARIGGAGEPSSPPRGGGGGGVGGRETQSATSSNPKARGAVAPGTTPAAPAPRSTARGEDAMPVKARDEAPPGSPPPGPSTGSSSGDGWRALVVEVEKASPALGNALKHAVPIAFGGEEVSVRMPAGMARSTVMRRRAEIETIIARFSGRPARLLLLEGAPESEPTAAQASVPESLAAMEQAERSARSARVQAAARAHPNVQQAAKILGGEVIKIEEL